MTKGDTLFMSFHNCLKIQGRIISPVTGQQFQNLSSPVFINLLLISSLNLFIHCVTHVVLVLCQLFLLDINYISRENFTLSLTSLYRNKQKSSSVWLLFPSLIFSVPVSKVVTFYENRWQKPYTALHRVSFGFNKYIVYPSSAQRKTFGVLRWERQCTHGQIYILCMSNSKPQVHLLCWA